MDSPPPGDPIRCRWCDGASIYMAYHDTEWGFPVGDDTRLFEQLCLEGFQSGLSWLTILKKREAFRRAFAGFDIATLVRFDDRDVERLLADAGIVRHRGKIEAVINNARCAERLLEREATLAAYVWRYEAKRTEFRVGAARSTEAQAMAADLKRQGWRFVGPTTVYAFMQAIGLVNDHQADCHVRVAAEAARERFAVPGR
ncbi:hydrolase [Paludibacterium paludis]|uniref:Hydrolase n=2 Tax=Paludibacterium paludis TaxID=1225769 RepID=A0A918P3K7_9NEIS|nr:DNA-3-methyladenine glycosylase I [Paludibacterium paludis]GGY17339.1 hydrolase [Paludibacterium paludis]